MGLDWSVRIGTTISRREISRSRLLALDTFIDPGVAWCPMFREIAQRYLLSEWLWAASRGGRFPSGPLHLASLADTGAKSPERLAALGALSCGPV
jgi:hypothetical protein